jgi:outer membrane protein, multidrug efflux system
MRSMARLCRVLLVVASAAIVAACALKGPPTAADLQVDALAHTRPPANWTAKDAVPLPVAERWLASFNDAALSALVDEALLHNADLRIAAARVEQSEGYVKAASGSLYPSLALVAHGGDKSGGDGGGLQGVWLNGSLELDVWGRIRYGTAATEALSASAQADYAYARQSLAAMVAKSWFIAIEAGIQRAVAKDMVRASEELLRLAQERLRIGVSDEQAVADARGSLGNARDTLRQTEFAREQALRSLELLLGRYPSAEIEVAQIFPALPPPAPVGLPSELLERRPDVIAAERRVAAAFDRTEEARAAQLPRLSLTAGGSSISSQLFVLQDHSNPVWSFGANLIAPLYLGGTLRAQVEIRTAEQSQSVAEYARVGQRAFGEVEGSLAAEIAMREREAILVATERDNVRALELAQIQYRVGKVDLRAVEQRQLALYVTRTTLLHVRSEQLAQRVNLHLALGGGFEPVVAALR